MVNHTFTILKVLVKEIHKWKVKCDCGNEFLIMKQHVTGGQEHCIKCIGKASRFSNSKLWKSTAKFLPGMKFGKIKASAAKRKIEFDVTREYLDEIFQNQNGKCVYTGFELGFVTTGHHMTASLDRIDSSKGYLPGNVQWVHKDVNRMKWDLPETQFIEICQRITENFAGK